MIRLLCCLVFAFLLGGIGLPAPAEAAMFGTRNPPGSGAVPTDLPNGTYRSETYAFVVQDGQLSLAEPARTPGRVTLAQGGAREVIDIRADHLCISTVSELQAVIALDLRSKSGLTVCLNPGDYRALDWSKLYGAFEGMTTMRPMTFQSVDPSNPAVLGPWTLTSKRGGATGNMTFRDLVFQISTTELDPPAKPFTKQLYALRIGMGGITRNLLLENVTVRGSHREAFVDPRSTDHLLQGVHGWGENIIIRNSTFTRLMDALMIWGEDILIEHNRGYQLWGDFVRLSAVPNGPQMPKCRPSQRMIVRNNIVSDFWSNNRFHPDVIHLFPYANVPCGLRDVLIEGNIAYIGREGARQPGFPTGFSETQPIPAPAQLALDTARLQTLIGPGKVQLPRPVCPDKPVTIAVQRAATGGPITLYPAPGSHMEFLGKSHRSYEIRGDWEVWKLRCPGKGQNFWIMDPEKNGPQGFFSNQVPGPDGYKNMVIRNNILWLTSVNAIRFSDPDSDGFIIQNNSLLQPFPGDANGDGRPNTRADGFNEGWPGQQIIVVGKRLLIRNNISATHPVREGMQDWPANDNGIRSADQGASMLQRFAVPGGISGLFPTTPREAVELARPRDPGMLSARQMGAVASSAAKDWYDWSWVPDR